MRRKIMALAATAAMLGANAAAHAINTARAALKSATGAPAPGDDVIPRAGDGRNILPSIPPLPTEAEPKPAARKAGASKGTAPRISKTRDRGAKRSSRKKKESTA